MKDSIDNKILLKYLMINEYNVHGKIESIDSWQIHDDTYTMSIKVPTRVSMLDTFKTQNWSIITTSMYFTINKSKFDTFHDKEIRNKKINNIIKK